MRKNFLHFLSTEPCIMNLNGEYFGTIDNENNNQLDIISNCKTLYVSYNPITETYNIPYTFKLDNNIKCTHDYIDVVPFPNNHYDIIMKPFYYYQINTSHILFSTNIENLYISIIADNTTQISIYEENSQILNIKAPQLISARAEIKKKLLIIEGVISEKEYYLLVIDTRNFEILYNDISHSIEKSLDTIKTLKFLNDLSHHAEVCSITFDNKSKDIYYVYKNNLAHKPKHKELIPLAFLESLKIKDDNLCKEFLDNHYLDTPIDKFREYFGKYTNIYFNRHNINCSTINYTIKKENKYKNYNFIIEKNLIKDIEEIF